MEALRAHLAALSEHIPPHTLPSSPSSTRIACLSQTHIAVLQTSPATSIASTDSITTTHTTTLHIYPTSTLPTGNPSCAPIPLPPDAHTLLPARDMLAIAGTSSLTVIDRPTSHTPHVRPVAQPLFLSRPSLRLLHTAWAPHSPGFLLILTTDAHLRLFDVLSRPSSDMERLRLRIVANAAAPISFAFARGPSWHALAVHLLMSDGSIFVVCPIAPIGTRLPRSVWNHLRSIARSVISSSSSTSNSQPLHDSDSSAWSIRQAHMQLRFLEHVFEPTPAGDLVAVREFKPAPLLFQGPLFIEHDDITDEHPSTNAYVSLTVLNCAPNIPPVLLRTTDHGHVSVLLAMEAVEPQWYLSPDLPVTHPDQTSSQLTEPSAEYAACAQQVAPSLLCFEHLVFPNGPVRLVSLGGQTDADVLFAITSTAAHSLRLSFVAVLSNPDALERIPQSSISTLFTISPTISAHDDSAIDKGILGLTPLYVTGEGPVAIVLTADGLLHATAPIRWAADFDSALPPSLLAPASAAERVWTVERPLAGNRAFACSDLGKDVLQVLERVRTLSSNATTRVAPGTLGRVNKIQSMSSVLEHLESRVVAMTGESVSSPAGVLDALGNLSSLLATWAHALVERSAQNTNDVFELTHDFGRTSTAEQNVKRKLDRVVQIAALLDARVIAVKRAVLRGAGQLSRAEAAHVSRLRERKRRLAALRVRLDELAGAIRAPDLQKGSIVQQDLFATPPRSIGQSPVTRRRLSLANGTSITPVRDNQRLSVGGSPWRMTEPPLARRRPEWSPRKDVVEFSQKELLQIRAALEKHSSEIQKAMELSSTLWKRLSVT